MDRSLAFEAQELPAPVVNGRGEWSTALDLRSHSERLESLVTASARLLAPSSLRNAAELVADALTSVLGAVHLSVHLLDATQQHFETLVQRGTNLPIGGDVMDLSPSAAAFVTQAWHSGTWPQPVIIPEPAAVAHPAIDLPAEMGCVLVLPLIRNCEVFGFVLVDLGDVEPPAESLLGVASALAAHIAVAVDRAELSEQVAAGAQLARALMSVEAADDQHPHAWLEVLRARTPAAIGFEITNVRFYDRTRASLATDLERELWRKWRTRRTKPEPVEDDVTVYAPVWGSDHVIGMLSARLRHGPLEPREHRHLDSIAAALGEVVDRRRLRESVARLDQQLAMYDERAQVVEDLGKQVDEVLVAIQRLADEVPSTTEGSAAWVRRLTALTREGRERLRHTARSIGALEYDAAGFEASLALLVSRFGAVLEAAADVEVRGEARPLDGAVERTLLRVLHEALAWLQPGARSSNIAVRLTYLPTSVELAVRDDGSSIDIRQRGPIASGPYVAFRSIRDRLRRFDGELRITWPEPRGLLIRARIPT
ncbi:MAG: hypothetical protein ACT452_13300 [Microthrixaceae bacterium]